MKYRRSTPTPTIIDQDYLNSIYSSLQEKIQQLDYLNKQFKTKKEDQFIHTFMTIIQKIGGELILAQEAYKNVDKQAKKDQYCLQLAQELKFFKQESFNLKDMLQNTNKELSNIKQQKQAIEVQLKHVRQLLQKKTKQKFEIKSQNRQLKLQLKSLMTSVQSNTNKNVNLSINLHPYDEKDDKIGSMTNLLEKTSPNFNFSAHTPQKRKDNSMVLQTAVNTNRTGYSVTLSPVAKPLKKQITPYLYEINRNIRTKKTARGHRRILPEEYNPQTNV